MGRFLRVRTSRLLAVALGLALGAAPWLLMPARFSAGQTAPGEIPSLAEALKTADPTTAGVLVDTPPPLSAALAATTALVTPPPPPTPPTLAEAKLPAEPAAALPAGPGDGPAIVSPGHATTHDASAETSAAKQDAKTSEAAKTGDEANAGKPAVMADASSAPPAPLPLESLATGSSERSLSTAKTPAADAAVEAARKAPVYLPGPETIVEKKDPPDGAGPVPTLAAPAAAEPAQNAAVTVRLPPIVAPLPVADGARSATPHDDAAPRPMPAMPESAPRSEQLESLAREADAQVRHGFELANREAYFAAQAEFVAALRLVAQALDAEHHSTQHSRALSNGLMALREAQDFLPRGSKTEADLDLPTLVAGHRTPVLKNAAADDLRAISALRAYFTYAQEQLAVAGGHEVAGSMALYALGKLHATCARQNVSEIAACEPKAKVFYQAALLVVPDNYMASNDLGVLLARAGNYQDARGMLEHSAALQRNSVVLANLAMVYRQLAQQREADQARREMEVARRIETLRQQSLRGSGNGLVTWLDSGTFAQTGNVSADPPRATAAAPAAAASAGAAANATSTKAAAGWRPWSSE